MIKINIVDNTHLILLKGERNMDSRDIKELPDAEDLSTSKGRLFKKDPAINAISKEEFEDRADKTFHLLWKTLAKSFGPYGAPTLIYSHPWYHITKDGYTIMKNLSMDASETYVDTCIYQLASDICGRLNYTVGDGTTTAIIATNSIYQNYRKFSEDFANSFILPRDVIYKYDQIKETIISKLHEKVRQIRSDDMNELKKNIHDVVFISSNGDEEMTKYISEMYGELGGPAITCSASSDGVTRSKIIKGYKYNLVLNDRLYINNDEETMDVRNADIIIFGSKVTIDTYNFILKPLNTACKMRGRKLIVAAPTYDETAMRQTIATELTNEYRKDKSVNMVLTTYSAVNTHTRRLAQDFAMLMDTVIIDRSLESFIIDKLAAGTDIASIFNIDERNIKGLKCVAIGDQLCTYNKYVDELPDDFTAFNDNKGLELIDNYIELGYVKEGTIGLKSSMFTEFEYNEERYKAVVAEAKSTLDETIKKYKKLGTFNIETSQAQERYYSLCLNMGVIEVGADSELSQKMIKDAVDDAVKGASSAYYHGVVLGCNVNLIQVITDMIRENTDSLTGVLLDILFKGFVDVYRTVLSNAFNDNVFTIGKDDVSKMEILVDEYFKARFNVDTNTVFTDRESYSKALMMSYVNRHNEKITIHDVIIYYSLLTSQVFDIPKFKFTTDVINSAQTDEEVLKATIDLIALLIVGNQMVVTGKHNFID